MVKPAVETPEAAMLVLSQIKDPEVPVLNIVEMGIVRRVVLTPGQTLVEITPTYSGCPAMEAIEGLIREALSNAGFPEVKLERIYSPAWTTDWMTEDARGKLKAYGIAPPAPIAGLVQLDAEPESPGCPYCGSSQTELRSIFGATACKSLHFCRECQQPFESFKAI